MTQTKVIKLNNSKISNTKIRQGVVLSAPFINQDGKGRKILDKLTHKIFSMSEQGWSDWDNWNDWDRD